MFNKHFAQDKSLHVQNGEERIMIAFCLFCCEVFFIYRNFRIPSGDFNPVIISMVGGFIAIVSACILCLVLLAIYIFKNKKLNSESHLSIACGISFVVPIIQFILVYLLRITWCVAPCIALTAVSFVCIAPTIIDKLARIGVSCTVRCNIAACLALLVAAPLSHLLPIALFTIMMAINPLIILYCLRTSTLVRNVAQPVKAEEKQKFPRILFFTISAACIMEGVVATIDCVNMSDELKAVVFSLGYVASALVVFLVLFYKRDNYNNVIFKICFPIMTIGVSFFVFENAGALNVGSFIFLIGRQLFVATISALIVYMVRYLGSDCYLLTFGTVVGAMTGVFIGSVLSQMFGILSSDGFIPPAFLLYLVLGLMFVAIYLMSASNIKTRWGMITIDDSDESSELTFEQISLMLAEKWGLTKRESEIVGLLIKGRDGQAIAERLFISEGTVKVHVRNIYKKMDIHSKQDLIDIVETSERSFK